MWFIGIFMRYCRSIINRVRGERYVAGCRVKEMGYFSESVHYGGLIRIRCVETEYTYSYSNKLFPKTLLYCYKVTGDVIGTDDPYTAMYGRSLWFPSVFPSIIVKCLTRDFKTKIYIGLFLDVIASFIEKSISQQNRT